MGPKNGRIFTLTPEQRLLGHILVADWRLGASRIWPQPQEPIDWQLIPDLAWQYKMRPMVAKAIAESAWPVPEDIQRRTEDGARQCAAATARQSPVCFEVLAAAARTVPIPGPGHLLRLTVAHGARHGWDRWKWLGDLNAIFRMTSADQLRQMRECAPGTGRGR